MPLNQHNSPVKKLSYAKINIGLNILEKRADGFHEIETIFQEISLHDTLEFRRGETILIESKSPQCPTDHSNLVYKAAELLNNHVNLSNGIKVTIHKTIPVGGGLGGGSSNAACALVFLNDFWHLALSPNVLKTIGSKIGSDVPFFLQGGTAFGSGRGEKLERIKLFNNYWGILVTPSYGISTKWAFERSNFNLTKTNKKSNFGTFVQKSTDLEQWQNVLKNDLEPAVFSAYPELGDIIDLLYKHGAFYAQMSGSGSSLYGLFENKNVALQAQYSLTKYKAFLFGPVKKL